MRDPRAASRMATDLSGMSAYTAQEPGVLLDAEPAGIATAQPGSTFLSATPEDDTNIVMKTIGTVLGAPFNLLRGAKEGLEDAIGHPYAMQRDAQDEQYAMLASVLSDSDKAAMGMPVDRTGVNARQTNTSTVATGNNYGISPTLTPRKTGIVELLTGESRKQRALQMAKLQAALKAQGINLNIEAVKSGIYKDNMAGWKDEMQGFKTQNEAWEVPANNKAWRATEAAKQAEHYAGAYENTMQGYQAKAKGDQTYTLTPGIDARNWGAAAASNAQALRTNTLLPIQATTETMRAARERARVDKEVATGTAGPATMRAATDAASKLEAALAKVRPGFWGSINQKGATPKEKQVYMEFGVPEKKNELGLGTGEYDVEAWRKTLIPDASETKSTDDIIAGIMQSIEDMKRQLDTGEKSSPSVASPAMDAPAVNTDSWTPQQWDADIPQGLKPEEAIQYIIKKGGKSRKQAADIVRMIAASQKKQ